MPTQPTQVRDKFWIFTCVAGADGPLLAKGGVTRPSRMTPAEGALYLDVPNLILVRAEGEPAKPYDPYAVSFRPLDRVLWSIVGSGGRHESDELSDVLDLADRYPNIAGAFMDDFFKHDGGAQLAPEQLRAVRERLAVAGRPLELWVVAYTHMLAREMAAHLDLCDVVTLWTWNMNDLKDLESNLDRLEQISPGPRKALGLYLWDYPNAEPVPVELMQRQCEAGLGWLREGRIDSMIFLANTVMDFDFESVEWTRDWIRQVGQETL